MRIELEIAKENIEVRNCIPEEYKHESKSCEQHKATLQRMKEFLDTLVGVLLSNKESSMNIDNKLKDISEAIKEYDKAGI